MYVLAGRAPGVGSTFELRARNGYGWSDWSAGGYVRSDADVTPTLPLPSPAAPPAPPPSTPPPASPPQPPPPPPPLELPAAVQQCGTGDSNPQPPASPPDYPPLRPIWCQKADDLVSEGT